MTWMDAAKYCAAKGYQLAIVETIGDFQKVKELGNIYSGVKAKWCTTILALQVFLLLPMHMTPI